jgi:hypothetical protein
VRAVAASLARLWGARADCFRQSSMRTRLLHLALTSMTDMWDHREHARLFGTPTRNAEKDKTMRYTNSSIGNW